MQNHLNKSVTHKNNAHFINLEEKAGDQKQELVVQIDTQAESALNSNYKQKVTAGQDSAKMSEFFA